MEKAYAQALNNALRNGTSEDALIKSLLAHLAEAGRMKLLPKILSELKALNARTKSIDATVEVASEKEANDALLAAKARGIEATTARVNPSLITGWRARKGSVLIDQSAKRALIDLYRRITS